MSPYVAGLITLAMVVFGQVCALDQFVALGSPAAAAANQSTPAADEHAGTCTSEKCGGQRDTSCPTGSAECCSTWGPPTSRIFLSPPQSLPMTLADAWRVTADLDVVRERAQEVALFELARPPGFLAGASLASSLSRRGPPALS